MWRGALPLAFALSISCAGSSSRSVELDELTGRSVLSPQRFVVLSSRQETSDLPSAVALGAKASGRVLLYFEFPALSEERDLLRAQLLLSAVQGSRDGVEVEVARAEGPGLELSRWSQRPGALHPRLSRNIAWRGAPERLDVTELVRARGRDGEPLRLVVRAEPGEGEGVLIATGAAGGEAPRLELYFR